MHIRKFMNIAIVITFQGMKTHIQDKDFAVIFVSIFCPTRCAI